MGVCVLGSINLDIIQGVDRLPRPGETILSRSTRRLLGGKGANQAVCAARMGARARLLGAVGADPDGEDLLGQLASNGVDVSRVSRSRDASTGAAHIWVSSDGENMIVVSAGANAAVGPDTWPAAAWQGFGVYLAQLETPVAAVRGWFGSPVARAGVKILNAAPALAEAAPLFELVDIIVVNEVELAAYADLARPPDGPGEAEPAARGLLRREDQTAIVTLGAAGVLTVSREGAHWTKGRPVEVVDTTGAGDCFCGALAASLSRGEALAGAIATANAAAALSVGRPGAAPSMPFRAEVETFLQSRAASAL